MSDSAKIVLGDMFREIRIAHLFSHLIRNSNYIIAICIYTCAFHFYTGTFQKTKQNKIVSNRTFCRKSKSKLSIFGNIENCLNFSASFEHYVCNNAKYTSSALLSFTPLENIPLTFVC